MSAHAAAPYGRCLWCSRPLTARQPRHCTGCRGALSWEQELPTPPCGAHWDAAPDLDLDLTP